MATETGPDLSAARAQFEKLMDDTATVVRPVLMSAEALDEAPVVVPETPCLIGDRADGRGQEEDEYRFPHRASLPVNPETNNILEGDVLIVLSSRRDPTLVDRSFVVRAVKRGTFLVARSLGMDRFEPGGTTPDAWPEEVTP